MVVHSAHPHKSFLSTLSLRRATTLILLMERLKEYLISIHALLAESDFSDLVIASDIIHFYPRSPCGERLIPDICDKAGVLISIHALLAESDIGTLRTVSVKKTFLSTLSLRRATWGVRKAVGSLMISIHALLAESDVVH